ncbi:MAG: DUF1854 domain-containing protein [Gemmatimonadota bacterium]|nr:MAG: DUF1854 domain-containing protein [Gemmatimonadota bacterium]
MKEPKDNQAEAPADASWEAELGRLEMIGPERVRVWRDEFRRLHVQLDGETEHVDVKPARVFPVSGAADLVSFLDHDGKEVLLVENPEGLDPESRRTLQEEIARTYFVPKITYVYDIEDSHGAARWEVETDRGYRVFDVRDREDVRVLEGTRVLLQDADGNRFEVEDLTLLDERSRRLIDKEI